MSGTYLTGLADWLRAAGLQVVEYSGWQSRARSSGGYASGRPWCVMWHHTASGASMDGQGDADYMVKGSPDAPLANLYIERSGTVWVLAAGATNTNGKGRAVGFSRGTVPADSMNTYAVGIEVGNNGIGEKWPQAQVDAFFAASLAVTNGCGLMPSDVCTHQYYAPDRKIDTATAAAVQGPWKPRSANSSGSWNVNDVSDECVARSGITPVPPQPTPVPPHPGPYPPVTDEEDMKLYAYLDPNGTIWMGNGVERWVLQSMDQFNMYVAMSNGSGIPQVLNGQGKPVRQTQDLTTISGIQLDVLGKVR